MWDKIRNLLWQAPFLKDISEGKLSLTLWFAYCTFLIAAGSVVALHFKAGLFAATCTAICFWVLATVFYRMRRIDNFKIDLKEHKIEIDGDDDDNGDKANDEKKDKPAATSDES